ncbi:hypothetical protein ASE14_02995 [Agromyces sp. Root81]|uniref:hydantoinase/oxoprolinase N-terminal domain-containing protein n=1 Tax=Agromyces sp. Root81 TaxID=1736601 RepID=UPI00070120FB|nr:hydantoinase/oxoprolinase N-terminal domain-containing protein [Agromyces sp. Root81]KRC62798.1 hypothetical protein ASE14_02995 [Agromyces sp. Root81]
MTTVPPNGGGLRLGIITGTSHVEVAAIDRDDEVVAAGRWEREVLMEDQSGDGLGWSTSVEHALASVVDATASTRIQSIVVGGTHLRETLDSRRPLARVGVLRLGAPATTAAPPFAGWPDSLVRRIGGPRTIVAGGADLDGSDLAQLDEAAVIRFAKSCDGAIDAIAISGVFSPVAAAGELRAADLVADVLGPAVPVTVSHSIGGFGLLDRENAGILNAALIPAGEQMVASTRAVLTRLGIDAELFFVQNDGTLQVAAAATSTPIRFLDGSLAATIRGAGWLAATSDAVVVALESASTRAGVLRERSVALEIGPSITAGVRMNVELPLGYALDAGSVAEAVELMSRHAPQVPTIIVGDGAVPSAGLGRVPRYAEIAGAVGAALAPVSAVAWEVVMAGSDEASRIRDARQRAVDLAILAGADPSTSEVVAVGETDLSQMLGGARRLRFRAEGRPFTPTTEPHHTERAEAHHQERQESRESP